MLLIDTEDRAAMKLAFIVHNDFLTPRVMDLVRNAGIDYYTRWDRATGKGAGTEPHLGSGGYASTNSVLMIAFDDHGPLEKLIAAITASNISDSQRQADSVEALFLAESAIEKPGSKLRLSR